VRRKYRRPTRYDWILRKARRWPDRLSCSMWYWTAPEYRSGSAGNPTTAHRWAVPGGGRSKYDPDPRLADIVIVSAGAIRKILNMYQSQKALDNAASGKSNPAANHLGCAVSGRTGARDFRRMDGWETTPARILERIQKDFGFRWA